MSQGLFFFLSFSFSSHESDLIDSKDIRPRTLQEKQKSNTNSSSAYGITYFIIKYVRFIEKVAKVILLPSDCSVDVKNSYDIPSLERHAEN